MLNIKRAQETRRGDGGPTDLYMRIVETRKQYHVDSILSG